MATQKQRGRLLDVVEIRADNGAVANDAVSQGSRSEDHSTQQGVYRVRTWNGFGLLRPFGRGVLGLLVVWGCLSGTAEGQEPQERSWLLPMPEVQADPEIPTLEEVVGHRWGTEISSHAETLRYLEALAEAAPDRAKLMPYGRSYEGRSLVYLVIASAETIGRLDEVRADNQKLADPRTLKAEEIDAVINRAPAIVWLAYSVHGDESSSTDAALLTAYTLLADQRPETQAWLDNLVVIIDPLQNPDGRDRFVGSYRRGRGVFPQASPWASERIQPWPGGRYNHYLFDMNRDWYLHSQIETKAKVAAYLDWQPQVYVDAHEMGANSNYYFDPSSDPINPQITSRQADWVTRIGRRQAELFDRFGFAYTTREIFDAFYPGYGSTWPMMQGGLGILWEQAGVRGLLVDRENETTLHYHDAVRHHYVSGLATIEAASNGRADLLRMFTDGRAEAIERGQSGESPDVFLLPGSTPQRAASLARLLKANGIEVRRLTEPVEVDLGSGGFKQLAPSGSYYVPAAQPAGRLAETLLAERQEMDEAFIARQLDRKAQRLGDEIYDVTAWSLPLTFGIEALRGQPAQQPASEPIDDEGDRPVGSVEGPDRPLVGYLVPTEDEAGLNALSDWLQQGFRVHVIEQSFVLDGNSFASGTLLLRTAENPDRLHTAVREAAERHGVSITGIDSSFVDEGAGLGGPNVSWVEPPRVLLAVETPVSPFVGHTWYLFDQVWKYPTTRVAASELAGSVDLEDFNVIILPDGNYGRSSRFDSATADRLRRWVTSGGTLILVDGALRWGIEEEIGLVPTDRREVPVPPVPGEGLDPADDSESLNADPAPSGSEDPPKETPRPVPGAILRATVYGDHWVTVGLPESIEILTQTSLIVDPLDPTEGRNLVTFDPQDEPVSGFCWPDTLKAISRSPLVLSQSIGDGHIIGFTDDPNARALSPVTQRLFRNAVFFGPGH
ncbi:M14 family metallopeptidase [Tautonia rosea]|uniref:M14 family metallopeptidase n=1 Tax=Tautonia rosea TaxID=2728037 RepID=UPI001473E384|nr:M14 family metallopeptidase [Tautonia rosea]